MPRNRRERRAFERKNKSGMWKSCVGASALAAVVAAQLGIIPASATGAVTRVVDIQGEDYNNDSELSLREAIEIARPGDIIDISGVNGDLYVDGPITIDKSLTILGGGDGNQSIRSLAKRASDDGWGFNDNDLSDDGREGDYFVDWESNDWDTYVGNTIFSIEAQIDRGIDDVVPTTVVFKDIAISGHSVEGYVSNGDFYYVELETQLNYLPLITIDEEHQGEVIFDAATIEDTLTVAGYRDYNVLDSNEFHVFLPSASGVANYSIADLEGDGDPTTVSFVNDSHIYNMNFNSALDWDNQFYKLSGNDGDDEFNFVDGDEDSPTDFEDGDGINVSSWGGFGFMGNYGGSGSAVFSAIGDINFENSFAENNSTYTENISRDGNAGQDEGPWTAGTVFGLTLGDLSITDSRMENNTLESGFGGVGFLLDGDLTVSATADGESVVQNNRVYLGSGGAFHLGLLYGGLGPSDYSRDGNYPGGTFSIEGDVTFAGNASLLGGAIFANGENDSASTIVGGAYFVDNYVYGTGFGPFGGAGGAIFVRGSLSIYAEEGESDAARFVSNEAEGSGGAIFLDSQAWDYDDAGVEGTVNDSGNLFIQNADFFGNIAAEYDGGAIAIDRHEFDTSDITIEESEFFANTSDDEGGALFVTGGVEGSGDLTIYDTYFEANGAQGGINAFDGGAVFIDTAVNVSIEDSYFRSNDATEDGAAIWVDNDMYLDFDGGYETFDGTIDVTDSTFINNEAMEDGGAIYTAQDLTVRDSFFDDNYAQSDGGAIATRDDESLYVFDSEFEDNRANDDEGGALFSYDDIYVYDSLFLDNDARDGYGGAIYAYDDVYVQRSTFTSNEAEDGGAIYAYENLTVISSTFVANTAEYDGGALYVEDGDATVLNSTFTENEAGDDGSVLYIDGDDVYLAFNTIVNQGNSAYGAGDQGDNIIDSDTGYINLVGNIIGDNSGNDLDIDGNVTDDGYNVVTDEYTLGDYGMLDGVRTEKMSILVNWDDLGLLSLDDNGGPVDTFALENSSVAVRFLVPGNVVDWDTAGWLSNLEHVGRDSTGEDLELTISQIVSADARGKARGNIADAGAYEFSVKVASGGSGIGGGGGGGSTPEPTPTPEPTDPPVANDPVTASVAGFAPGSSVLTKAIKKSLKATVAANAEFKAVVLRGFTVVTSDLRLAKARANAVRKYILKLAPEMASKVLKGKLGNSRKVKMTFKDAL